MGLSTISRSKKMSQLGEKVLQRYLTVSAYYFSVFCVVFFLAFQRPAEKQIGPGDEEDGTDAASQKRSAPGFVFRPSSLQKATQGFALKQPSLKPQLESHTPSKPSE